MTDTQYHVRLRTHPLTAQHKAKSMFGCACSPTVGNYILKLIAHSACFCRCSVDCAGHSPHFEWARDGCIICVGGRPRVQPLFCNSCWVVAASLDSGIGRTEGSLARQGVRRIQKRWSVSDICLYLSRRSRRSPEFPTLLAGWLRRL